MLSASVSDYLGEHRMRMLKQAVDGEEAKGGFDAFFPNQRCGTMRSGPAVDNVEMLALRFASHLSMVSIRPCWKKIRRVTLGK